MEHLKVEKIFIHKNMIKKMKRDQYLKEQLIQFHHTFRDWLLEGTSYLEQLENGVYANKLLYHKLIVFDRPNDLESVVFWDFLTNDHSFETNDSIDDGLHQRDTFDIIEGNQFIFFTITDQSFEQKVEELCQSNQLELQFVLDSEQNAALSSYYDDMKNLAITGAAGAGKTLMLNRIAHTALENDMSFLYVTFSNTLKERFNHFLKEDMEKVGTPSFITTYEDLIRKYIAPQFNIEAKNYMRFNDCQSFLEYSWQKIQKDSKIHTKLSKKDVCRILMTLPTNNVGEYNETKGKTLPSIIQTKLKKLKSTESWALHDEDCEFIKVAATQYSHYAKKQHKKHWSDLLHEIDSKLESNKTYINYPYVLIDEMQDLGQFEFMLLIRLLDHSRDLKLIATYDSNQRISFEGSTDRNFENRLSLFEHKIYLPHSYRNAANIYKLAEKFKKSDKETSNAQQSLKTNINLNKVKFLLSQDTDELINQVTSRFIPEENLNIGVLAFGQTYEKYYHSFLHEDGRKKFIGIEYYNEEQIKGLEFTNLIIIDFLALYRVSQNISPIEMRKWYVAITRACDNLLIHIQDKNELTVLNNKNISLFEEDYSQHFFDVDEAIEQFNDDILVSLGDEQKTLLAQEAQQLLYMYREKKEYDYLEDAVDIFYKIGMLESLRNLLEIVFSEQGVDRKSIAYELVKVCIELNDETLIRKYMPFVHINQYYKIEEKVKKEKQTLHPFVQELFSEKPKSRKTILNEVRQKTIPLKENGDYDQYIRVCSEHELYGDIINLYKLKPNQQLSKESYKRIGRAYQKEGKDKDAIAFYIDHQMYVEAMSFYEGNGNYKEAFIKCIEILQKSPSPALEEKAYQLAMKLYEEQYFKQLLDTSNNEGSSTIIRVLYELFKITKNQKYFQQGLETAYQQQEYVAIIRFYDKEKDIKDNKQYQTYLIEAFESVQRYEELATLYNDLEDYASAYTAFHQAYEFKPSENLIVELNMMTTDFIDGNFSFNVKQLLEKHFQQMMAICEKQNPSLGVKLLIKLEKIEEAVKFANRFELFNEVIQLAQDYTVIRSSCSVDVAKAYENIGEFEESAVVHKEVGRFASAAMMLVKAKKPLNELLKPLLYPVVEQVRQQPTLLNEKVNDFIISTFTADFKSLKIQEEYHVKTGQGWLNTWIEKLISTSETGEEAFYYQYLSQNKTHVQQVLKTLFLRESYDELIQFYTLREKEITTIDELGFVIQSYEVIKLQSKAHYDVHFKRITTISKRVQIYKEEENALLLDALSQSVRYIISSEYFSELVHIKQLFRILKPIDFFLSEEVKEILIEIALINQVSLLHKKETAYPLMEFVERLINDVEFKGFVKFLNKVEIDPQKKKYYDLYLFLQFKIHTYLYQACFAQFVESKMQQIELAKHEKHFNEFHIEEKRLKEFSFAFQLIIESIEKMMKENNLDDLFELELEVEEGRKSPVTYQYEREIIDKKEKFLNQIKQFLQEGKDLRPLLNKAKRERKGVTLNPVEVKKQREKFTNIYQEAKRNYERETELFNQKLSKVYDFVRLYPHFLMPNMVETDSKINHPITYMFLRDELVVKTSTTIGRLPIIHSVNVINRLELCKNNEKIVKMLQNLLPIKNTLVVERSEKEKSYDYIRDNTWEKIEEIMPLLEQQRKEYQDSLVKMRNNHNKTAITSTLHVNEEEKEPISRSEPTEVLPAMESEGEVKKISQKSELKIRLDAIKRKESDQIEVEKTVLHNEKVQPTEQQKNIKTYVDAKREMTNHIVEETKEDEPILNEVTITLKNERSGQENKNSTPIKKDETKVGYAQLSDKEPNVELMFKLLDRNVQAIAEVCGVDEEFVAFCTAKEDEPSYATRQLLENYDNKLIPLLAQATGINQHVLFQYKKYIKNK